MPNVACVEILIAIALCAALMAVDALMRWLSDRARERRRLAPRRD